MNKNDLSTEADKYAMKRHKERVKYTTREQKTKGIQRNKEIYIYIYIYKPRGDKQILKDTKREKIEIKRVRAIKRDRIYRGKNKYMCQETGYAAVVE